MLSPTTTFDTKRSDLGLVAAAFVDDQTQFIAKDIYPIVPVDLDTDKYTKIKVSSLSKAGSSKRAPGTGFQRDNVEIDQDSYTTDFYGREGVIPKEVARKYERYIRMEPFVTRQKMGQMLREMDVALAAHLFSRTTFPVAATTGHDASNLWSDMTNADPVLDVTRTAIVALAGVLNDTEGFSMAIGWKDYLNLCAGTKLRASTVLGLKAANKDASNIVLPTADVAGVLNLKDIVVGKQNYMSAGTDASPTLSPIWDGYALIFRRCAPNLGGGGADQIEPGLGFIPAWNQGQGIWEINSYIEPQKNSGVVQVSGNYGIEDCNIEAGYLIKVR